MLKVITRSLAAAWLLCATTATAQNVVQQVGPVVPGDAVVWTSNGQIADGGNAAVSSSGSYQWPGKQVFGPSTSGSASFNLALGTSPTTPVDGDCWTTTAGFFCRINGVTHGPYEAGTVTSVGVGNIAGVTTAGAPVTTTGSVSQTLNSQTANTIFAAPSDSSGTPSFRALNATDMAPLLSATNTWSGAQTFSNNLNYTATGGSGPRSAQARASDCVNVLDYGAVGDNATDNITAFNAATTSAISLNKAICVPRGSYVLSAQWSITSPVDIFMDPSTNIRFTTAGSCGILMDLRGASVNFGLNNIRLGGLYSPAINSSFAFPGYPSAWSSASRSSCDAFMLEGGSRINIDINYIVGFNAGVRIAATWDATNGARAPQNINVHVNTADLNTYGAAFIGGPSNAGQLAAIYAEFNTNFAKFPFYFDSSTHGIGQVNARVTGQAFVNEAGGACAYDNGSNTNTTTIDIAWCYAGYSSFDSPTGTSTTLSVPFLAGVSTSNTLTTDGNCTVGYWNGSNNLITIGLAVDQSGSPGGAVPVSGQCTRIRNVGANNDVSVRNYTQTQGSAIALSTTIGEANFNGGVGGAAVSKRILASAVVPTLTAGTGSTFYFYSTLLSAGQQKAVRIVGLDNSIADSGLSVSAKDQATVHNREGVVTFDNKTAGSITGATYFFYIITE